MSNNKEFDKNRGSQYNFETVIKESADYYGKSLRTIDTRSVVNEFYTHFRATYDGSNNPTEVTYYRGTGSHKTTVYTSSAASLSGKYFSIYTAPDEHKYTVWFNVDGVSLPPIVSGTYAYIEVPVDSSDSASIVALAIALKINTSYSDFFQVNKSTDENQIDILTANLGETQDSVVGNSGFIIQNTSGTQAIVQSIVIDYNGVNPVFNGQELVDYNYDIYSGKFVKNPEVTIQNVQIAVELDKDEDSVAVWNSDGSAIELDVPLSSVATEATQEQVLDQLSSLTRGVGSPDSNTLRTAAAQVGLDPNGVATVAGLPGIDNSNSTNTILGAGGVFTGSWKDLSSYVNITLMIKSDVMSAVNGIQVQFSHDGTTVLRNLTGTYLVNSNGLYLTLPVEAKYYRLIYTNGGTSQTSFTIQSMLDVTSTGTATVPINFPLTDDNSVVINRSIITGKSTDGAYANQRADGISTGNSTSTPLAAGATFIGTWEDVLGYANISLTLNTSHTSATDGLSIEYSTDGINVDASDVYTIVAGGGQLTIGVTSKYFRIRYTNGPTPQTHFRLQSVYHITAPKPSSVRISDSISGENDSELVKAVTTGLNPNDTFVNIRAQGSHSGNSSITPLTANATYRGTWFNWQANYTKLVSALKSDVSGTLYIDFSQVTNPTNGVDTDITDSVTVPYDALASVSLLKRHTPVQSLWVRHRYINGNAAQSSFLLDAAFLVEEPGLALTPAGILPTQNSMAGIVRNIPVIPNADGTGYQEVSVHSTTGKPLSDINKIHDDILLRALSSASVAEITVGTTATRLDPSPLENRRAVMVTNDGSTTAAVGFSSDLTYNARSFKLPAGTTKSFSFSEAVQFWALVQDTGGIQTTLTRSGASASGTGGSVNNALVSDNVYATISAAAQTVAVSGYTAGTANALVSVKIGLEGNKQSGQTETVAIGEVQTGSTTGAGTVSSASLAGGDNQLYVAIVSRNASTGTVTSVTGGGQVFTASSAINITSGNRRQDVWYAYGTFSAGTITASLSTSTNAHIVVYRITNASSTTPIQSISSTTGSGTAVSGPAISGTNKGYSILSISHTSLSGTAGAGYTENSDQTNGTGSNTDTLSTESKALVSTGLETGTYTLATSSAWSAIGLTITPRTAIDPVVNLSYKLSGVTGAISGDITLSSSTDSSTTVDITPDRAWVAADIANIQVIATGTTISSAIANIDYLYVQVIDTTGNTTNISIVQGGEAVT